MQGRNAILVVAALVIGVAAVILANAYFSGVEERQAAVAEQQKLVRIVVATQPLEFGEPLTQQNIKLANFPANSVPQGAFRSIPAALKDNRVALRPLVPGEPVLASKVSGSDGRATLAALLPDGFRAISVPVNNVSGFVLPGMTVDVLLLRQIEGSGATGQDQRADLILENVQVLAIDQIADDKRGKPKVSRTVTLALTPTDAARLALADRMGALRLTLRKPEALAFSKPSEGEQRRLASTITSRDLGLPRLIIGGRSNAGGGSGGDSAPPRRPVLASISTPIVRTPAAYPNTGPAMTVVRGTQPTNYEVGLLGGSQ